MEETRAFENITKWLPASFEVDGAYDTPIILPVDDVPEVDRVVRFCDAKRERLDDRTLVHFYTQDYQFERIWTHIDAYIPMMQRAGVMLSPDFSLFTDLPRAMQIYNHYRKHYIARYYQRNGVCVIPSIGWSDRESVAWCFGGEPEHAIVSVSSIGCMRHGEDVRKLFMYGYDAMLERLAPEAILFFGTVPDGARGNIIRMDNEWQNPNGKRRK